MKVSRDGGRMYSEFYNKTENNYASQHGHQRNSLYHYNKWVLRAILILIYGFVVGFAIYGVFLTSHAIRFHSQYVYISSLTHTGGRTVIDPGLQHNSVDSPLNQKYNVSLVTIQRTGIAFVTFVSSSMIDFGVNWYKAALSAGIPRDLILVGAMDRNVEIELARFGIPFLRLNETQELDAQRKAYCGINNCKSFRKMAPAKVSNQIKLH